MNSRNQIFNHDQILDYTIPVLVFSMLGRFSITFALNTVLQLNYEIMPTQLRAQGSHALAKSSHLCLRSPG